MKLTTSRDIAQWASQLTACWDGNARNNMEAMTRSIRANMPDWGCEVEDLDWAAVEVMAYQLLDEINERDERFRTICKTITNGG